MSGQTRNRYTLERDFYRRDARIVARELLGCVLLQNPGNGTRNSGRIVETEAYLPDDPASHSFRGRTSRNSAMFLDGGHAYVYQIYGIHHCLNVVTGTEGEGAAVLIRAVEILDGIDMLWRQRYSEEMPAEIRQFLDATTSDNLSLSARLRDSPQAIERSERRYMKQVRDISNGPGKLCQAFAISIGNHNGTDLTGDGSLSILRGEAVDEALVEKSPRIGLARGKGDMENWRFFVRNSSFLSR